MSHANGQIKFLKDNKIMYFEYNGTVDVAIPCLYETNTEMVANWRKGVWKECSCNKDEAVEIATNYGGGFYWRGRACRRCFAITENLGWGYKTRLDGLPKWWAL